MNKMLKKKVFSFLSTHLNTEKPEVLPIDFIREKLSELGAFISSHEMGRLMKDLGNPRERRYEWFGPYRRRITSYKILKDGGKVNG